MQSEMKFENAFSESELVRFFGISYSQGKAVHQILIADNDIKGAIETAPYGSRLAQAKYDCASPALFYALRLPRLASSPTEDQWVSKIMATLRTVGAKESAILEMEQKIFCSRLTGYVKPGHSCELCR